MLFPSVRAVRFYLTGVASPFKFAFAGTHARVDFFALEGNIGELGM